MTKTWAHARRMHELLERPKKQVVAPQLRAHLTRELLSMTQASPLRCRPSSGQQALCGSGPQKQLQEEAGV